MYYTDYTTAAPFVNAHVGIGHRCGQASRFSPGECQTAGPTGAFVRALLPERFSPFGKVPASTPPADVCGQSCRLSAGNAKPGDDLASLSACVRTASGEAVEPSRKERTFREGAVLTGARRGRIIFMLLNVMRGAVRVEAYQELAKITKAIAHPTRLRILEILGQGEACVCHMTHLLGQRQPYISQQLMTLREAGLVRDRKDGVMVY